MSFPGGASGKEPPCQCRRHNRGGFDPWVEQSPWRRAWQPTPVLSPGDTHGQRSLVGYRPWGHKETGLERLSAKCQQGSQHTVWLHGERLMKSFKYDDCIYEKIIYTFRKWSACVPCDVEHCFTVMGLWGRYSLPSIISILLLFCKNETVLRI